MTPDLDKMADEWFRTWDRLDPATWRAFARAVAEACEKEHVCVTRASESCVYLHDGTKVVLKRRGAAVWLVVEPQAIIRPADDLAPRQEEAK